MTRIAFDIGGTNIRVARVSLDGIGEVRKVPTSQEPNKGVVKLAELARDIAGREPIEVAAGGLPGIVVNGVIKDAPNLPQWAGLAFEKEFSTALGGASVAVRNDSDMAALGEAVYGAGKGKRVVAYMGIGTGVGGGRIVDGQIDTGAYGLEPGHQIIDVKELKDLEYFVSGRAFEKRFGVHPKDAPREAYSEMTPILAAGLYNTMLHWSPDVLVLGGSMVVGVNGYRIEEVVSALKKIPGKLPFMPELRMAELKDAAGLHGARALLGQKH